MQNRISIILIFSLFQYKDSFMFFLRDHNGNKAFQFYLCYPCRHIVFHIYIYVAKIIICIFAWLQINDKRNSYVGAFLEQGDRCDAWYGNLNFAHKALYMPPQWQNLKNFEIASEVLLTKIMQLLWHEVFNDQSYGGRETISYIVTVQFSAPPRSTSAAFNPP